MSTNTLEATNTTTNTNMRVNEPPLYNVIIYNDIDTHPLFVADILKIVFGIVTETSLSHFEKPVDIIVVTTLPSCFFGITISVASTASPHFTPHSVSLISINSSPFVPLPHEEMKAAAIIKHAIDNKTNIFLFIPLLLTVFMAIF